MVCNAYWFSKVEGHSKARSHEAGVFDRALSFSIARTLRSDALKSLIVFTLTEYLFRVSESRCGFQFEVSNHFLQLLQ